MNKPRIELKNIKHFAAGSQETYCYTANVYVDGKRWGTTENDGRGGPDNIHALEGDWQEVNKLNERVKATYPRTESEWFPDGLATTLEILFGDLVTDHLRRKEFNKLLKQDVFITADGKGLYVTKGRLKPDPTKVEMRRNPNDGRTYLADLPREEAYELYKKHS